MIPVKSISQLSNFLLQGESLIPFELIVLDSNISLNRYSLSASDTRYNNIFAGDLEDGDLYLEVSYLSSNGAYVPRKFDFSNYLRYIENALSILNNGIMGVYLTKAQADELYVKKIGDEMTGPLSITMSNSSQIAIGAPLQITDTREIYQEDTAGAILVKGSKKSLILLYDSDSIPKAKFTVVGHDPEVAINNIMTATPESIRLSTDLVTASDVTTPHIADSTSAEKLSLSSVYVDHVLSANDGIDSKNRLNVSTGNVTVSNGNVTASGTISAPTINGTSTLKCNNTFVATNNTSVIANKLLTANDGISTKSLTVVDSGSNILLADASKILLYKLTEINEKCTVVDKSFYITSNSPTTGNIVMTGTSPKIYFGSESGDSPYISYDNTLTAFVITSLNVSDKLTVGSRTGTAATNVDTNTNANNPVLVVNGDALYTYSLFSSLAVKAEKLVTTNFTANLIEAKEKFIQSTGIAELTAKRACWA